MRYSRSRSVSRSVGDSELQKSSAIRSARNSCFGRLGRAAATMWISGQGFAALAAAGYAHTTGKLGVYSMGPRPDGQPGLNFGLNPARSKSVEAGLKHRSAAFGEWTAAVTTGLVSGQPEWARGISRSLYDVCAVHPYAKQPNSVELDRMLQADGTKLDAVVLITADTDEVVGRLLKRAEIEGRADDTEEVIRHRMSVYEEQTAPLIDSYASRDLVVTVDGLGAVDEVTGRIVAALASKGVQA